MPALQSPWFVPHVIVYIFSYALLAASSLVAVYGLYQLYFRTVELSTLKLADNLVYIGFSFSPLDYYLALYGQKNLGTLLDLGSKGNLGISYLVELLICLQFRIYQPKKVKAPLWSLSLAFIVLLICWFGINYLPPHRIACMCMPGKCS